jgi:hypothetical protein
VGWSRGCQLSRGRWRIDADQRAGGGEEVDQCRLLASQPKGCDEVDRLRSDEVDRRKATTQAATAATTRGGGGATRGGGDSNAATMRPRDWGGDHSDNCNTCGCNYSGGRGVSALNGLVFDCPDLHCELG